MEWEDEEGRTWSARKLYDGGIRLSFFEDQGGFMMETGANLSREKWLDIVGILTPAGLTPKVKMYLDMAYQKIIEPSDEIEDGDTDEVPNNGV